MLYYSTETKILRLLLKIKQQVPGVYERFITDGVLDIQKAKDVFFNQGGRTRKSLNDAVSFLVAQGYANLQGITPAGEAKIAQIDTARNAEALRLGVDPRFIGTAEPALIAQLNALDL